MGGFFCYFNFRFQIEQSTDNHDALKLEHAIQQRKDVEENTRQRN